uniref:Uncharacterized protein n=1 Tax=Arundo donax TaxID=35708 RepID=A0A0A9BBC3_ARUDO
MPPRSSGSRPTCSLPPARPRFLLTCTSPSCGPTSSSVRWGAPCCNSPESTRCRPPTCRKCCLVLTTSNTRQPLVSLSSCPERRASWRTPSSGWSPAP